MRIAIATFSGMPPEFTDDQVLVAALAERGASAELVSWDQAAQGWDAYDLVVIRSTWDYARRREEFLAWCDSVGESLHNRASLVRWNSDKRYLGALAGAGIATVPTTFVEPGAAPPRLEGEVVVKPNVSAGARDSGRFGPAAHAEAEALIAGICDSGRTAMVQPYQPSVDTAGETAVLMIDGAPAHALRKRAVLRPDEVAPTRDDPVGAAEVMYDPELVTPTDAAPDELEFAHLVVEHITERFEYLPLYARVDMIRDADGAPTLLELEAIEPNFYLGQVPASVPRVAEAVLARAEG